MALRGAARQTFDVTLGPLLVIAPLALTGCRVTGCPDIERCVSSQAEADRLNAGATCPEYAYCPPVEGGSIQDATVRDTGDADTCVADGRAQSIPCQQSLASYCASGHVAFPNGGCGSTWSGIQEAPLCDSADGLQILEATCGSLNVMSIDGVDSGTSYLYDTTSGALIAVLSASNPGPQFVCQAGPPCLVLPTCGHQTMVSCPDASIGDAGGEE